MDPLTQALMQRAIGSQSAPGAQPPTPVQPQGPIPASQGLQTPVPAVPPSGGQTHTPPELKRFANAQAMMDAYRNNWTPNPILLQAARRNT